MVIKLVVVSIFIILCLLVTEYLERKSRFSELLSRTTITREELKSHAYFCKRYTIIRVGDKSVHILDFGTNGKVYAKSIQGSSLYSIRVER